MRVVSAGFKAGQGAQARSIGWEEEKVPTLAAEAGGNSVPSVCVAYDARGNGDGKTASTITGDHENRITDYTTVVCEGFRQTEYGEYKQDNVASALKARDYKSATDLIVIRYIVRRLTPTECARLQGFPDRWGDIDPLDISDEREVDFWREIYKTYCIINGLKVSASILSKPDRLKKWHDKLHTDSAEYKMYGNGVALPNVIYVMQGISDFLNER